MSSKAKNQPPSDDMEGKTDAFDFEDFGDEEIDEDFPEENASAGDPFDFGGAEENTPKTPPPPPPQPKAKAPVAPKVKPAAAANPASQAGGAALVQDASVQVAAVLGKKTMTVGELVNLKKGEVLDLDRFPNEAIDLMSSGKLMAKGELVEVDGKLGVRIIKIF